MSVIVLPIIAFTICVVLARKASLGICSAAAVFLFFASGFLGSIALGLLFLALLVCSITASFKSLSPYQFRLSVGVISGAMLFLFGLIGYRCFEMQKLAVEYPAVSLRDRVVPSQVPVVANFPAIEPAYENYHERERLTAIEELHRSAVTHFLDAPEFGVVRMSFDPLAILKNDDESPIHLSPYEEFKGDKKFESDSTHTPDLNILERKHDHLQSWFVNDSRNGVVEDIDHVAGFLPHAINERPAAWWRSDELWFNPPQDESDNPETQFNLRCLQLVGLLYHNTPVVYDLETAPTLVDAKTAPTRPLDEFENRALEVLKKGNPLYYEVHGEKMRMMGALVNANSCTQCHTGPTNQLLGAFTYILTTDKAAVEVEELAQVRAARAIVKTP